MSDAVNLRETLENNRDEIRKGLTLFGLPSVVGALAGLGHKRYDTVDNIRNSLSKVHNVTDFNEIKDLKSFRDFMVKYNPDGLKDIIDHDIDVFTAEGKTYVREKPPIKSSKMLSDAHRKAMLSDIPKSVLGPALVWSALGSGAFIASREAKNRGYFDKLNDFFSKEAGNVDLFSECVLKVAEVYTETLRGLSKEANINEPFENKDLNPISGNKALGLGTAAVAAGVTFAGASQIKPETLFNAIDNAVAGVGKNTAKALGRKRILTDTLYNTMVNAGKVTNDVKGRVRTDWSQAIPAKKGVDPRKVAATLLLIGGVSAIEDVLTNAVRNKVNELGPELKEELHAEIEKDINLVKNKFNKVANIQDIATTVGSTGNNSGVKASDTKRFLSGNLVKPAIMATSFFLPLAVASRAVGRNLYGGFERVRSDEDLNNTSKIIIDLPNSQYTAKEVYEPSKALDKKAGLSSAKEKIRKYVADNPKSFAKKFDDLIQAGNYDGPKDLAHFLVEEVPGKALQGFAYAAPGVATATLFNRNIKRAFEPIQDEPGLQRGRSRIIIETNQGVPNTEKLAGAEGEELLKGLRSDIEKFLTEEQENALNRRSPANIDVVRGVRKRERLRG